MTASNDGDDDPTRRVSRASSEVGRAARRIGFQRLLKYAILFQSSKLVQYVDRTNKLCSFLLKNMLDGFLA